MDLCVQVSSHCIVFPESLVSGEIHMIYTYIQNCNSCCSTSASIHVGGGYMGEHIIHGAVSWRLRGLHFGRHWWDPGGNTHSHTHPAAKIGFVTVLLILCVSCEGAPGRQYHQCGHGSLVSLRSSHQVQGGQFAATADPLQPNTGKS